jgi:two-component system KDP operon response regulator KdpE
MPGARILLVEDDKLNQALVRTVLARSADLVLRDADLVVAGSLAEARVVLASGPVDVVLLDMQLPDGSGLALAAELRSQSAPPPAVVALTGAAAEQRGPALAAGCAAVLGKPYTPADLCELLAAHLPRGQPATPRPAWAAPSPSDF